MTHKNKKLVRHFSLCPQAWALLSTSHFQISSTFAINSVKKRYSANMASNFSKRMFTFVIEMLFFVRGQFISCFINHQHS